MRPVDLRSRIGTNLGKVGDVQSILDKNGIHRDERLADAAADKLDAMAALATNTVIGGERESKQPHGLIGRERTGQAEAGTAA